MTVPWMQISKTSMSGIFVDPVALVLATSAGVAAHLLFFGANHVIAQGVGIGGRIENPQCLRILLFSFLKEWNRFGVAKSRRFDEQSEISGHRRSRSRPALPCDLTRSHRHCLHSVRPCPSLSNDHRFLYCFTMGSISQIQLKRKF